jgi:hypothetical protein
MAVVKRVAPLASALILATTCLWVGTASSQDDPVTTTEAPVTTTEAPVTTTEAPVTTTEAPADTEAPTTTEAPAPTTTAAPAPIDLPGEHVLAGSLGIDVRFADTPASNCTKTVDLAGGQVNVGYDESGNIGGVYGLTSSGAGSAGVYMVGLGAIPAGVGIVSVSDGECEFDAVGIGSYASDHGWARINGVGAGVHPGRYDTGEYVNMFLVDAKIGSTQAPAVLDMNYVKDFLLRDRPGLVLPQG